MSTLHLAGIFNESQRKQLANNTELVTLTMQNGEIIKRAHRPPARQLAACATSSDKRVLVLVTDSLVQYHRFFGVRGYQHVVTNDGMRYARGIAAHYAARIDHQRFAHAWNVFKTRMGAQNAKNRAIGNGDNEKEYVGW
jgi:hypothetical protein